MEQIKRTRLPALDYLRVLAAFLVVAVHADTITISSTNYLGGISWWIAAAVNTLGRVAVPLFIMISGALIYEQRSSSTKDVVERSIKRIVIPGTFWISLYFWWEHIWRGDPLTLSFIGHELWTSNFGYLHFLFIILGLYLATPLLQKIPENRRPAVACTTACAMVIFEYLRYTGTGWAWTGVTPLLWIGYIPYYMLGSVFLKVRWNKVAATVLTITAIGSWCWATLSKYLADVGINAGQPRWYMSQGFNYFWGHFSPTDMIIAVAMYYLVVNLLRRGINGAVDTYMAHLSSATFGIFLSHVMMMDALEYYAHWQVAAVTHSLWLYYIEKTVAIFILSYLLVLCIRFVRLQKILLGEWR